MADIKNPNKGTNDTNIAYHKNHGNGGKQLNPKIKKWWCLKLYADLFFPNLDWKNHCIFNTYNRFYLD